MLTAFVSDVHLGSAHARTGELLAYLASLRERRPKALYLVGDFVDGWKLRRGWRWDDACNRVVRKVLGLAKDGVAVRYVAGNHDDFLRPLVAAGPVEFGDVTVADRFEHRTADGRRLLVVHGDQFDATMRWAPWALAAGDRAYDALVGLNGALCRVRRRLGLRPWSLAAFVKRRAKAAAKLIGDYELALADYARAAGYDGVVCGHVHEPAVKRVGGLPYFNCGNFVEDATALEEDDRGAISLVRLDRA